jgi:hypothetical protein
LRKETSGRARVLCAHKAALKPVSMVAHLCYALLRYMNSTGSRTIWKLRSGQTRRERRPSQCSRRVCTVLGRRHLMTARLRRSWNQRAANWDRNTKDKLEAERRQKAERLDALPDEQAAAVAEGDARRTLQQAEMELTARGVAIEAAKGQLAAKRKELEDVVRVQRERTPELARQQQDLARHAAKVRRRTPAAVDRHARVFVDPCSHSTARGC